MNEMREEQKELPREWLLDPRTGKLQLEPDDAPMLEKWYDTRLEYKPSLKQRTKEAILLSLYFDLYGILAFLFLDNGSLPLDYTMQAVLFPVFAYLLISYRSFTKLIKAFFLSIFALYFITYPLISYGVITYKGVIFIKYLISFIRAVSPATLTDLETASVNDIMSVAAGIILILIVLEGILWIFYSLIKHPAACSIVLSKKYIFIKMQAKAVFFTYLKLVLLILINPFNVNNYRNFAKTSKYFVESNKEGRKYDYGRIPLSAIKSGDVKKMNRLKILIFGVILAILSFAFWLIMPIAFILIIIGLIPQKKYRAKIMFNRSKVEGAWVYSHTSDIFELYSLDEKTAEILKNFLENAANNDKL
ncbi:MAG: hypothetical protein ACTSU2_01485 [Promethearchaeota archaeon]